jgi:tetratricopeptide (TPR) repeat protein
MCALHSTMSAFTADEFWNEFMNRPQHFLVEQPDGALTQEPSVIKGLLGNAVRHHQAGRLTEAARIYRQILAVDKRQADSAHLLGMIAFHAGRHELAAGMIRKAIAINPKEASYHSDLGTVIHAQGDVQEAAACYRRALNLNPQVAEIHFNLGNILQSQEKLDAAVACHERALALKPELADAHHSLGNAFQSQGKLAEAVACYERALALRQDYAQAHYNLGCALRALGNVDEAAARFGSALALQPDYSQAGFTAALVQLLQGDFATGWQNYERRWQSIDHRTPMRRYPQPLWRGEKLASGRLLLWGEQGVGDEIMFAGLIPDVLRLGNRCLLDCDARLKPLFVRSFPGIDVIPRRDPTNDYAERHRELNIRAHLPCGSLPSLFRTSHAGFAATTSPYLLADPAKRDRFRARYAQSNERLVGLAWYTTNRKTGRDRSIDLSQFVPLFARPGIRWISLQYGDHDALEREKTAASAPILIDRSVDQLANLDLFAAQIAALDLVITIDNSTAHLAGALGVPAWVLLPFAPDWRWLLAREDSPWYPTLRLFRQPKRGDWQSVVREVATLL